MTKPDERTTDIRQLVKELHEVIGKDILAILPPMGAAALRMELFLSGTRWGVMSVCSMLLKQYVQDQNVAGMQSLFNADEKQMVDIAAFCAYMMLAQHRRLSKDIEGNIGNYMRDALEIFAVENERPFPHLYCVEQLLKRVEA